MPVWSNVVRPTGLPGLARRKGEIIERDGNEVWGIDKGDKKQRKGEKEERETQTNQVSY